MEHYFVSQGYKTRIFTKNVYICGPVPCA